MSEPWLSTHIERWPTEKLVPYARNARTHSEEQVAQIAASIVEFGFTNPILAGSDGVIVARSEEHTSELQSLLRISSAVFCLKKKNNYDTIRPIHASL